MTTPKRKRRRETTRFGGVAGASPATPVEVLPLAHVVEDPPGSGLYAGMEQFLEDPPGSGLFYAPRLIEDPPGSGLYPFPLQAL